MGKEGENKSIATGDKNGILRPEFSSKLSSLFSQELEELRKQDKQRIIDLENEIIQLKKTIQSKDEEIQRMKKRQSSREDILLSSSPIKKPRLIPSSSNLTRSVYDINSNKINIQTNARKSKSMYEDRHIMPTQYSDDDDEEESIIENSQDNKQDVNRNVLMKSSPTRGISLSRKPSVVSSSQVSVIFSPKRKLIGVDKLSPIKAGIKLGSIRLSPKLSPVKSTQYSSSSPVASQQKQQRQQSQLQPGVVVDDEIEDSEEEVSIIDSSGKSEDYFPDSPIIGIPKNITTILQKRQFLLKYYTDKFHNSIDFKINLIKNPINEISWDFGDFKQNPNYKPDNKHKSFIRNHKIINQQQYDKYKQFYQAVNNGDVKLEEEEDDDFEDKLSQIFDKFASPPGFMQSDFPNTQEQEKRKQIIKQRQLRRLARRIKSCVTLQNGIQIGEFIFTCDILNQYVIKGRWYIR
ncbi:uncharacterized protein J8A68_003698 [[Candida] subhashii]|uniref:Uncharacterized protein n=1 Tax=[Candida] subhashii TaxID=561895 RepID=A0A8J5QLP0_9ASCO|nr:uncharacterized protein J8A68_003698 [[Candida] subhashii]KAG7662775.1 hypothetical protein J8A68_003698 [[Candida] subhashii]